MEKTIKIMLVAVVFSIALVIALLSKSFGSTPTITQVVILPIMLIILLSIPFIMDKKVTLSIIKGALLRLLLLPVYTLILLLYIAIKVIESILNAKMYLYKKKLLLIIKRRRHIYYEMYSKLSGITEFPKINDIDKRILTEKLNKLSSETEELMYNNVTSALAVINFRIRKLNRLIGSIESMGLDDIRAIRE